MTKRGMAIAAIAMAMLVSACGVEKPYETLDGKKVGATSSTVPVSTPATIGCAKVKPFGWKVTPTKQQVIDVVRADKVPAVSGTTAAPGARTDQRFFATVDDYLTYAKLTDDAARRTVMESAGFRIGVYAQFLKAPKPYEVQSLVFRDAGAAVAYTAQRISTICPTAGATLIRLSPSNGIAYQGPDGRATAEFVLGDEAVSLTLGAPVQGNKMIALQRWYQAWVDAIGSGPAKPVT